MERLPMHKIREILRLRWVLGLGVRQAAASAGELPQAMRREASGTESSSVAPRNEGASSGPATRVQYVQVVPPRLSAASRHCGRMPSSAGRNTITISGIWKYV